MTVRRTVRLDDALDQRLKEYTESADVSPSEVIREALEEYLEGHAGKDRQTVTFGEKLRRSGLIGCIEDAPSDLSTNPKYMEGFGE
jgi:predicted transcriptional regulator